MIDETGFENPLQKILKDNKDKMRVMNPVKSESNINPMMGFMMNPMNENNMNNMGAMNIMNMMMMNQMNENMMNNIGGIKNINNSMNSSNENIMNKMGGMNMNNMMMNQMNKNSDNSIGMNDSSNLNMNSMISPSMILDENAERVKEIIKPYEYRIKELEETIRKLNFQLAVLKDKLKHVNNPSMVNSTDWDVIKINFEYGNEVQKIKCLKDELVMSIINKFCKKNNFNQNSLMFYFQNKIIPNYMTASEIGLENNFSIYAKNKINSSLNKFENQNNNNNIFPQKNNFGFDNNLNKINYNTERKINLIFNYKDKKVVILLGENSPVGDGLRAFLAKENINDNEYKGFTFVYDGSNISLTDQRRPNEVFKGLNPQIKVYG